METRKTARFKFIKELRGLNPSLPIDVLERYKTYNSDIESYERSLSGVLKGRTFEGLLRDRNEPIRAIDLMSTTEALASLFQKLPDKDKKGLAVGLSDMRVYDKRMNKEKRDADLNIDFLGTKYGGNATKGLMGDISSGATWDAIDDWLEGEKADLIIERAEGGLITLPHTDLFYKTMLQRVWDRLKSDGGMFIGQSFADQAYKTYDIDLLGWVDRATQQGIDLMYEEKMVPWSAGQKMILAGALRMTKHPDSPMMLPV